MSVRIPHRFLNRLTHSGSPKDVRVIVLGSFDPGEPDLPTLPKKWEDELHQLFSTPKYQRFNAVKNFYDRPANRFWGVMDRIHAPGLYEERGIRFRNPHGLKFFKGNDRDAVFGRQQAFCRANGIFISDIVKALRTSEFINIFNNFSDTAVDKWAIKFNTDHLIDLLSTNESIQVICNVKESRATPTINHHLAQVKAAILPTRIHCVPSTSGAAGNRYEELLPDWRRALRL